jgi:phage terminase large subunit
MESKRIVRTLYSDISQASERTFGLDVRTERMSWYRSRPREFALKVLGSRWWPAQEDVGRALLKNRRVVVRSGNGAGKSYVAADLALWFLYTHSPAVVVTTAPTERQVRGVLWKVIHRRFATARKRLPGKLLMTRIDLKNGSFATGKST